MALSSISLITPSNNAFQLVCLISEQLQGVVLGRMLMQYFGHFWSWEFKWKCENSILPLEVHLLPLFTECIFRNYGWNMEIAKGVQVDNNFPWNRGNFHTTIFSAEIIMMKEVFWHKSLTCCWWKLTEFWLLIIDASQFIFGRDKLTNQF